MPIILPKLLNGELQVTSIDPDAIKGTEPREMMYKGKKVNGTKIFVGNGQSFKVMAEPMTVLLAQQAAKNGELVAVPPSTKLPQYENTMQALPVAVKALKEAMKALPSGS